MSTTPCKRLSGRGRRRSWAVAVTILLAVSAAPSVSAHTWHRDSNGNVIGSPPETPEQLLDFCVSNRKHCSISIDHLSDRWQRHLEADRLNPVASTYKVITLLEYAQRVADGRMRPDRRLSRDLWARFWIGADGEELVPAAAGQIADENGETYQIRRVDGRSMRGALRRAWEHLGRPSRITLDDLAGVMIRYSDNAAADWFLHEFGGRSLERLIDRRLTGFHDTPPSINAMFLTYFLNPDWPGRPAVGGRMLSDFSGYGTHGYRDQMARWFTRLEDDEFTRRARGCQPAVLPWHRRVDACPPSVGEPGEAQMRRLFDGHSVRSTSRSQTALMTRLLERTLMDPAAHAVSERALEYRLDPRRYRNPGFRNRFRRHGAKSGSLRTNVGLASLAWTAYLESQPGAGGGTRRGAVTVHLRNLPGRQPDGRGGYSTPDIDFELPLHFAEAVVLNRDGFATAVLERLPPETPRPSLVIQLRKVEARAVGAERTLTVTARLRNAGPGEAETPGAVSLYLRTQAGAPSDAADEAAAERHTVPPLAPGESVEISFHVAVPGGREFFSIGLDGDGADGPVHWERLHFPTINHRSIGVRRHDLDGGDGHVRHVSGVAGGRVVRIEGTGRLPDNVGRGDALLLVSDGIEEVIGHVASRDGPDRLTLQRPLARTIRGAPFAIRRAYDDIQSWENDREGDLVGDGRVEVGVLYDDGVFRCRRDAGCRFEGARAMAMATIDGSVTNAAHFMSLEPADGHRHGGSIGEGVVLDGEGIVKHDIRVLDHHTRLSGLALRGFGGHEGAAAVAVERARGVLLSELLIHHFGGGGRAAGVAGGRLSDFTLRDSIVHDGRGVGVGIDHPSATALVENCTVVAVSGVGLREGSGLLDVRDTVSMANGGGDFQVRRGEQAHNLSSDDTASGPRSVRDRQPTELFGPVSRGDRDLRLRAGAEAAVGGAPD